MLMGIKLRAYPTQEQRLTLSQWMGAARVIWNAKCEEWRYESTFARKYLPVGTYAPIDASYAQYKTELTPYLSLVPAEILKDAANRWRDTMRNWINPKHPQKGPARRKKKTSSGSICLERRLFRFEVDPCSNELKLFIGTVRNNIGYLVFKHHGPFEIPKSLRIRKNAGVWWVSFCYGDSLDASSLKSKDDRLLTFRKESRETLEGRVIGLDRGIKVACHSDEEAFDYSTKEKASLAKKAQRIKRYQRRLARQKPGSNRRAKTKTKISRLHQKVTNIRENFCHQVSNRLTAVRDSDGFDKPSRVFVMENLSIQNMSKRPKAKKNPESGRWEKNGACRKTGLNRSILSMGWYKLELFLAYKAYRRGSLLIKVSPQFSSQECADCSHIHPANRVTQALFVCQECGHRDNADRNAARVLKKRAINMILDSGTELSEKNVLFFPDSGRGASVRLGGKNRRARVEASKKTDGSCYLEASPL